MKQKTQNSEAGEVSKENREKGAIIVEATLSLTIFMLAMFTMLSLIQVAYAQSRISVALCTATKQISQYANLYYITGLDESMPGSGGKSSELMNNLGEFIEEMGGHLGSIDGELGSLVEDAGGALAGDNIADYLKSAAGNALVLALMEKNLATGGSNSADEFYRIHHIENVDINQSKFLEGDSRDIFMGLTYDVKMIQFFNMDLGTFQIASWAYTTAWGS